MNDNGAAILALLAAAGVAWWALQGAQGIDSNWVNEATEDDNAPDLLDYGNQAVGGVSGLIEGSDEMNGNLPAFLASIRRGEGTSGPNGYRTLYGGALFSSYADHPARLGWPGGRLTDAQCAGAGYGPGCVSTAAGAYQINRPTFQRVAGIIGVADFSEASQDAIAIHLITEKGALADVLAGRIESAVNKVRRVWASLPGAGYAGQRTVSMATVLAEYQQAGGILA